MSNPTPTSPAKPKPSLPFFVYVIESPSESDIFNNKSEGDLLRQAIQLDQVPCVMHTTISRKSFEYALIVDLPKAMKNNKGLTPILHISAHGNRQEIGFSNGDRLSWNDLCDLLIPINKALSGNLMLCMSSCEGLAACLSALKDVNGDKPVIGVVGNAGEPTWSDTAVAYAAFYHLLAKRASLPTALAGMRAASDDNNWERMSTDDIRGAYIELLKPQTAEAAQAQLQQQAQVQPVATIPESVRPVA